MRLHPNAARLARALRLVRRPLAATAAVGAIVTLAGAQAPVGRQKPERRPATVRLTAAEAARLADSVRKTVTVQAAEGLVATPWATERLVSDPIAIDVDGRGTVYVTSSDRSGGLLDIRGHPTWVRDVHTLRTVDDLRSFYRRELAPARSAQNAWIPDLNKDGSHDWRDLAVPKERINRIRDRAGRGVADESLVMIEGFNEDPVDDVAGGLLAHDGALILAAAPDVWRLRDTNGDGRIDSKESISHGYNVHPAFFGHGLAGVQVGPDGRIYWAIGDMGFDLVDKDGHHWSQPNRGGIIRANADGTGLEVFASGLRNPQAFGFDELGNLIAVDNDGDHPGETERLVYVTNGSDAGWRSTWQYGKYTDPSNNRYNVWMDEGLFRPRFDGQAAYITPPVAPSHAGPASLAYNPGTALSERWRGHFFVSSFTGTPTSARIYAFRLEPQGAGFALASDTTLLQGILTVGMRFGPEGALYLADWIDGWGSKEKGRIWRLDAPAAAASPVRAEVRALLADSLTTRSADALRALLRHADLRVRMKAQLELARRGDAATLLAAAGDAAPEARLARLHALWGIGQLARASAAQGAALVPFLKDADAEVRAQAARVLGDVRHAPAADALIPLLADAAPRARFFAAEALGRIGYRAAVPAIVRMLADNDDRDVYLRQAGVTALARIGDTASVAALATHPSRGARLAAVVVLRRLRSPEVARFLADADEAVVTEAARAVNDEGGIAAARPALAAVLAQPRFAASAPLVRRAIAANQLVGTGEALDRVAAYATAADRPDSLRAEAVAALGAWPAPSPFDRVDGAWLGPMAPRDSAAPRAVVARIAAALPADASAPYALAVTNAVGRLRIREASPMLLATLRGEAPAPLRVAALRALRDVGSDDMQSVVRTALADRDAAVRTAALELLPALQLSDEASAEMLVGVMEKATVPEQQAAIAMLGTLKHARAHEALGQSLARLETGALAPELRLDVIDAARASGAPALRARVRRIDAALAAGTPSAPVREALEHGGNARRGREVVFNSTAAQCTRCHSIGAPGADVGPNLGKIGATLSREQLLEALLTPSARLAPGYGTVLLTLKNGKAVGGMLREESDAALVVETAPGRRQRVAQGEIAKRQNLPSPMPPMGARLKPREIRDVVEYLSTLR